MKPARKKPVDLGQVLVLVYDEDGHNGHGHVAKAVQHGDGVVFYGEDGRTLLAFTKWEPSGDAAA